MTIFSSEEMLLGVMLMQKENGLKQIPTGQNIMGELSSVDPLIHEAIINEKNRVEGRGNL